MAGSGKKWLIGCGVGCAASTLIMILLTVGGSFLMMRPLRDAVDNQKNLETRFGTREDFIPKAGGITPKRIKVFLTVRAELMNQCQDFEEIAESFQQMGELDKHGDDPPIGDVLKGVGGVMGSVFNIAGDIGKVNSVRNSELLDNGMGLGEYTWIYILAYNSWLGKVPNLGFEGDGGGYQNNQVKYIRELMLNHAQALEEAGRTKEAQLWSEEAGRLNRTEAGVPFASGNLPKEIVAALIPYREKFEASYCAAMSEFDLGVIQKKGLSFHAE